MDSESNNNIEHNKHISCISANLVNGNTLCLPQDVTKYILDLLMDNLFYDEFKCMERVSLSWFEYLNSKKIYIYSCFNYVTHSAGLITITTNKEAKLRNEFCSIYLECYPNNDKRGIVRFFRTEYHIFSRELPQELSKKYNHDISDLKFPSSPFNFYGASAELFTKYNVTQEYLDNIRKTCTKDLTKVKNLCVLTYCYDNESLKFRKTFEASKVEGKIVKSRYPIHYVIFDELYKDKLRKNKVNK